MQIFLHSRVMFRLTLPILSLALFATVQAQTTPQQPQNPATVAGPSATPIGSISGLAEDESYRVGPGDLIDVRVFGRPELTRETRVTNQGRIRLPFLEDVEVACLTENQLAQLITEKYKKYLRDPQIDVFVKEYKSQPVAVIGSVARPGQFQLQRRVRLLELLTFAGGPNLNAGGTVHIIRGSAPDFCEAREANAAGKRPPAIVSLSSAPAITQPPPDSSTSTPPSQASTNLPDPAAAQASVEQGQGELLAFKLQDVLNGLSESNPYVRPGDIISVPETDQVFIIGTVVKPGPVALRSKVTLLQAIGMAGGFLPDAAKGKVKVVRLEPGNKARKEYVYDLNKILKKQAEDVALLPNDVVDVPSSIAKNTARSLLSVGVGMTGALPYWIRQ